MSASTSQYLRPATDGRITIGVADLAVTDNRDTVLVTYALGSCIGVVVHDPVAHVSGMLHFMLPSSKSNPDKAQANPAMFGDTGIPLLFETCYELGATKGNMIVTAAGGAEILSDDGHFKIGTRNRTLLRKIFWKNNVLLAADDTGGTGSRTLVVRTSDGSVEVRSKGKGRMIWPI